VSLQHLSTGHPDSTIFIWKVQDKSMSSCSIAWHNNKQKIQEFGDVNTERIKTSSIIGSYLTDF
jgi:hypothetical protein